MPLSDKVTNIIGVKLPDWILNQLYKRSVQTSRDPYDPDPEAAGKRDNQNLVYLANKTGWVRMVSSINLETDRDFIA